MSVKVRPLEEGDFDKGFIYILSQLTTVGEVTQEMFLERLADIKNGPEYVYVVEDTESGKLLATGTLIIERKFIHECSKVGHVEDIVVIDSARGLGLGKFLIDHIIDEARSRGCYKVILDCSEENVAFYEKQGFTRKEVQMALYF